MSKANTLENDVLRKVFNNVEPAWDGVGNLFVSLHTGDPGDAGNQTTNEANYTSYARVSVARDNTGWTVVGDTSSNTAAINFPQCTGGSNTITHVGVGTANSGAGTLLYKGALNASLAVSNLITPSFPISALQIIED
jgi:hypothetical protein